MKESNEHPRLDSRKNSEGNLKLNNGKTPKHKVSADFSTSYKKVPSTKNLQNNVDKTKKMPEKKLKSICLDNIFQTEFSDKKDPYSNKMKNSTLLKKVGTPKTKKF